MTLPAGPKLLLRRFLSRHMLRQARARSVPMGPGTGCVTLIVAPHQDDCALGCGGLIASRTAAGGRVHIAYVTDGAASHRGHPTVTPAEVASMRAAEALESSAILGVPAGDVSFLGAPDGELPHLAPVAREALIGRIAGIVAAVGATEVFVTVRGDGSTEHEAANAMVRAALGAGTAATLYEYPIWSVWGPMRLRIHVMAAKRVRRQVLGRAILERKVAAIHAFRSQHSPVEPWADAVLPPGFLGFFEGAEEYFFEY